MDVENFLKENVFERKGIEVPEALLKNLVDGAVVKALKRGDKLVNQGEKIFNVSIHVEGVIAGYTEDGETGDNPVVDCICTKAGDIVVPPQELSAPAIMTLEALTKSRVINIPIELINYLMTKYVELGQIYVALLTEALERHHEHKEILQTCKTDERLKWFNEKYPDLQGMYGMGKWTARFLGRTKENISGNNTGKIKRKR